MFNLGEIWAFPTDTSFGLGVRADDTKGLLQLSKIKGDRSKKYFSLMCADEKMLREFAKVPDDFPVRTFFFESPRTAIFHPTEKLPKSKFWPEDKVAFRVSTIPEIASQISFPITSTSANKTGKSSIFKVEELKKFFGNKIKIYDNISVLQETLSSGIWDITETPPKQIR